jgi:ferredoxin/flavodoxin---NADP+ reductase
MALEWCQGTIVDRIVWSEGLFTIRIQVDGLEDFRPGQFLQVGCGAEVDGLASLVYRPYSAASPFGPVVDFFIVVVPEGELTPKLWKLRKGDGISVSKRAAGRFTLEHTPAAEVLWMVATGTGLAPYIAMLRDPKTWDRYQRFVVVHGVRAGSDLAYTDELQGFEQKYPGRLRFVSALTRENVAGSLSGRIPALLTGGELESAAGNELRSDNSAIMLCGNPAMLDDMESVLSERGIKRHRSKAPGQLVLERYW